MTPKEQAEQLARKCALSICGRIGVDPDETSNNQSIRDTILNHIPLQALLEVAKAAKCYCEYSNKNENGELLWGGGRLVKRCEVCIALQTLREQGIEL